MTLSWAHDYVIWTNLLQWSIPKSSSVKAMQNRAISDISFLSASCKLRMSAILLCPTQSFTLFTWFFFSYDGNFYFRFLDFFISYPSNCPSYALLLFEMWRLVCYKSDLLACINNLPTVFCVLHFWKSWYLVSFLDI